MVIPRAVAPLAACLLLAAGCAGAPVAPGGRPEPAPAARPAAAARVVEILVRDTPGEAASREPVLREALDLALTAFFGEQFPLDAWSRLGAAAGTTAPADAPPSPLVRIARERLDQAGHGGSGRVIAVWRPSLVGGRLVPDPPAGDAGPLLVDLLEPELDGVPWPAGILLVASDARAARLVVRFTLEARTTGRPPDLAALAREEGLDPDRVDWMRAAVSGRR